MSRSFIAEDPAPPLGDTPAAWIAAIAERRCRLAFRRLFETFAPRLKGYLLRQGLSSTAAEDLAQETLLAVWRKADQYDRGRADAEAWVYAIARNQRIDALRRERRAGQAPPDPPPPPSATPEDELGAVQQRRDVRQALNTLPREHADLVRRSFFEDQPHSRIAGELGIPLGTVKSRLRSAAERLRSALDGGIPAA